jgi:signal transduction histidine kinase
MSGDGTASMLVVDDEPRNRKLLVDYLLSEGYRVREAGDGLEALRLARRETPDVVLLDVMMPGMTGHEVCAALKREPRTRLSQVMLVTALSSMPDRVHGLDTGADDYLAKPVRREEFLAKVRALLRVRRVLVELEQAKEALSERNEELQLKKTLAQTLVHDLKSPLSAILGNLDLLEMRTEARHRYLVQRSKGGARRMLKMILNLLDVEALEEGKLTPVFDRTDVREVVRATLQEAEAPAGQRSLDLRLDAPVSAWAQADPVLLRRVIDNLISNAITHSPEGGTIDVTVASREEGIEFAIVDSGPGIPEEHRETVFEKYGQLDARREGTTANKGLGLTFCRLAVEAHGGTIWIDDAPSGGAAFRAILPAAVDDGPSREDEMEAVRF